MIPILLFLLACAPGWARPGAAGPAVEQALSEAGKRDLSQFAAAAAGTPVAVNPRRNFCTDDFFVYRDRPIESYALTCRNAALGLTLHHSARYDAATLFGANGRCSPKHWASVALWSRETEPFRLGGDTGRPSTGPRLLEVLRARDSREFLVRFTWVQGGDEFRLGYDLRTGAVPRRVFRPAGPFFLKAASIPLSFKTQAVINGRKIEYQNVPVDCEMEISPGDWYGR